MSLRFKIGDKVLISFPDDCDEEEKPILNGKVGTVDQVWSLIEGRSFDYEILLPAGSPLKKLGFDDNELAPAPYGGLMCLCEPSGVPFSPSCLECVPKLCP